MYVSPRAMRSRVNGVPRAANPRTTTERNSGRDVIDHDVDEAVVTDPICDLAEWIAAARQRIARTRNSRNHLYALTLCEYPSGYHRIRGCQFNGLRKAASESLRRQRRTGLRGISHEYE